MQKKLTLAGNWSAGCNSTGTSCIVTELTAGTSYQFRVRAMDGATNWSGWSNIHQVVTCLVGSC